MEQFRCRSDLGGNEVYKTVPKATVPAPQWLHVKTRLVVALVETYYPWAAYLTELSLFPEAIVNSVLAEIYQDRNDSFEGVLRLWSDIDLHRQTKYVVFSDGTESDVTVMMAWEGDVLTDKYVTREVYELYRDVHKLPETVIPIPLNAIRRRAPRT